MTLGKENDDRHEERPKVAAPKTDFRETGFFAIIVASLPWVPLFFLKFYFPEYYLKSNLRFLSDLLVFFWPPTAVLMMALGIYRVYFMKDKS